MGEAFRVFDTKIVVSKNDCLTEDSARQLLSQAQDLALIGGIFHLALELNDCLFENQTLDQFGGTYASKVSPALHLDRLSRQMDIQLDYFVVFSSVSSGKGNIGQTNYSFANCLLERLCEQRRADGLHGLAIQVCSLLSEQF